MRITTRGRYALRVMVDLAKRQEDGYVALKDIAKRQEISKKYLEQIVPVLNHAGLLKTVRGFQGGYQLARPAKDITVADVIQAAEGGLAPVACLDKNGLPCEKKATCPTRYVWNGLEEAMKNYLESVTLQDVVDREQTEFINDYSI